MAHVLRTCTQCGSTDTKQAWASLDEATTQGAFDKAWTCQSCAWPEFELAESEQEPAKA